jgi:CRP/FNR family transcriptional regulator, cyclic AMP receptor protein
MAGPRSIRGTIELLRAVPLFQDLSRREVRKVAEAGRELEFPAGRMVVQEGSVASDFYLILSGRATVSRRMRRIRSLEPGDFFGEISVLDGGPRSATVVAETRLLVFRLDRPAFLRVLNSEGSIGRKLLQGMAERLRTAERARVHF